MKQAITSEQWEELSPMQQDFLATWITRKHYTKELTIGNILEALIGFSFNLTRENSDGRFFNKLLLNSESIIGWDGVELVDILWYELRQVIKKRVSKDMLY